jgi:uncharacterized protein
MRSNPFLFISIVVIFILLTDAYAFRGLSQITQNLSGRHRTGISLIFWLITAVILVWFLYLVLNYAKFEYDNFYYHITILFGAIVLFYVPKLLFNVFLLLNDIGSFFSYLLSLAKPSVAAADGEKISRADFLIKLGLVISAIPFFSILYGIWKGKYNFTVEKLVLRFPNLPSAFEGVRIVHISDFHIGSFDRKPGEVDNAVELINEQNADYVLFTGDIVNNKASELQPFISKLSKIKAKKGKYSILGNHDYGDYYEWESKSAKAENMQELYNYHEKMGFELLRNKGVRLSSGDQQIGLIGVENWGLPPFPQHGDLNKAHDAVKDLPFNILMSHDPSHWEEEVLGKKNIDLTLSGHTHGMQFAVRIPGWRWSPVSMKYKRWGGLYQEGTQKLYVNIGIGFIGFPGRVGTPPEITVFELRRG